MEFLLIDYDKMLPQEIFTYKNFDKIVLGHRQNKISNRQMYNLLEKLFISSEKIKSFIHFKWTENLSSFYSQNLENNHHIPMFKYWYDGKHKLRIDIREAYKKPEGYKWNDHPQLFFANQRQGRATVILKLIEKANSENVKYIMSGMRVFEKK
ncbi:hypothetical protein UABHE_002500 [Candidatus Uabimicrobium helgolandensis]